MTQCCLISRHNSKNVCTLGFLFRSRRFFTPSTRPRLSRILFATVERRPPTINLPTQIQFRLIDDPTLTASLDSLTHRTSVSALFLFYKYYHQGMCSDELIPPKCCFACSTRFATPKIPSRLNWKSGETYYSPIDLSP